MNDILPGTRQRVALLLVACSLVLAPTASARAAVIELLSEVTVAGPLVRLGDIARIHDAEPDEQAALENLPLTTLPANGGRLVIEGVDVRNRLRATGADLSATVFAGHARVAVKPRPAPSAPRTPKPMAAVGDHEYDRAQRVVERQILLHERRRDPDLAFKVDVRLQREDVRTILGVAATGFHIDAGVRRPDGIHAYRLRFPDRNERLREVTVTARLTPLPRVLVVRRSVPRGHVLRAEDLHWKQVRDVSDGITRIEDAVGRELTRALRTDQILNQRSVRSVPLVRVNEVVTVTAHVGGIRVKTIMKARKDGAVGDLVPFVGLADRREITARVTGYHTAEVPSTGAATTWTARTAPPTRGTGLQFRRPATKPDAATRPTSASIRSPERRTLVGGTRTVERDASATPRATARSAARPTVVRAGSTAGIGRVSANRGGVVQVGYERVQGGGR